MRYEKPAKSNQQSRFVEILSSIGDPSIEALAVSLTTQVATLSGLSGLCRFVPMDFPYETACNMLTPNDNAWQAFCLYDQVTMVLVIGTVEPSPLLAKSGSNCTPLTNFPDSVYAKN
jgi:hypothetical protein